MALVDGEARGSDELITLVMLGSDTVRVSSREVIAAATPVAI